MGRGKSWDAATLAKVNVCLEIGPSLRKIAEKMGIKYGTMRQAHKGSTSRRRLGVSSCAMTVVKEKEGEWRRAAAHFRKRLLACVSARGGTFEL